MSESISGQDIEDAFAKAQYEELRYLRYFYGEADFGPADSDVRMIINEGYDKPIPEGYADEE